MKILVFDTETTGLPEKDASIYKFDQWPYIIQLSYIFYDMSNNNVIVKDDYIRLHESITITPESFEIHKLNHEFLNANGKHIIPALREFNNYLDKCDIVVGHNISFDKRMIFVECLRNRVEQNFTKFKGKEKISKPEYCTMKNTKEYCNLLHLSKNNITYFKSPKLSELYTILFPGTPLPNELHNSLVDILCTFRCYMKFIHDIDIIEKNEKICEIFLQLK
tara:strand:- start:77 stop:739 length:663 start_codon:yes stop_codon:yes gene_type:complete